MKELAVDVTSATLTVHAHKAFTILFKFRYVVSLSTGKLCTMSDVTDYLLTIDNDKAGATKIAEGTATSKPLYNRMLP